VNAFALPCLAWIGKASRPPVPVSKPHHLGAGRTSGTRIWRLAPSHARSPTPKTGTWPPLWHPFWIHLPTLQTANIRQPAPGQAQARSRKLVPGSRPGTGARCRFRVLADPRNRRLATVIGRDPKARTGFRLRPQLRFPASTTGIWNRAGAQILAAVFAVGSRRDSSQVCVCGACNWAISSVGNGRRESGLPR
jgi:hypothetical protein